MDNVMGRAPADSHTPVHGTRPFWILLVVSVLLASCSGSSDEPPAPKQSAFDQREETLEQREAALEERDERLDERARRLGERAKELRRSEFEKRAKMAISRAASEAASMQQSANRFAGIVELGALKLKSGAEFTVPRGILLARELKRATAAALARLKGVAFPLRYRRNALNLQIEIASLRHLTKVALRRCGIRDSGSDKRGGGKRGSDSKRRQPAGVRRNCKKATIPLVGLVRRIKDLLEQITPLT